MGLTRHIRVFTLTGPVKRFLESKDYVLTCTKCGNPLQIGEQIVSKRRTTSRSSSLKYFHLKCWRSLFHWRSIVETAYTMRFGAIPTTFSATYNTWTKNTQSNPH